MWGRTTLLQVYSTGEEKRTKERRKKKKRIDHALQINIGSGSRVELNCTETILNVFCVSLQ